MGRMTSEQASLKKRLGHSEESTFNVIFGDKTQDTMNFSGSSEDNIVTNKKYKEIISSVLRNAKTYTVSLKSGVTWQFHLGRMDELSDLKSIQQSKNQKGHSIVKHSVSFENQKKALGKISFWNKYLAKAELLCYNNQHNNYTFFEMGAVTRFLAKEVEWKILETGRLKGALLLNSKKYSVLTFEYRPSHRSFAFGAMAGSNGLRLFNILKEFIPYVEIDPSDRVENITTKKLAKKTIRSNSSGKVGAMSFDENYFYICVAKDKWKKVKLSNV